MLKYRAEIDGLRAIAVLSVIFYHAGFSFFQGGYVGVDVFFVISGFLITSIMLNELDCNSFSILHFYEKRARRILPALFFVLFVSVPFAWLILEATDLESFFKSLNAIPLFMANHFFWKDVDYFAVASELKPLIHTWSLAVEEQYYLLFPILFLLLGRKRNGRKYVLRTLVFLALLSLVYSQALSSINVSKNFFLLPTRFWEIAIGSLIAFFPQGFSNVKIIKKQFLAGFGFFLILFSIFIFTKDTPMPSLYALVPTAGTAFVILYATTETFVGKMLSNKMLVGVGLVSYSAYLWHQPIFAFSRYFLGQHDLGIATTGSLILLSMILAWFSWKYIEAPFRNKINFKRPLIFKLSIATSLFFIFFGFVFSKAFNDYGTDEKSASLLANRPSIYFSGIRNEAIFMENLINAQLVSPDIVVIGSSRIMQIRSPDERRLLNLGVSGSALRDNIGMIYLVENKFDPSTVIIEVAPWLYSSQMTDGRYKVLENAYYSSIGKRHVEVTPVSFMSSFKKTIQAFYDQTTYSYQIPKADNPEIKAKKRNDGSHVYDTSFASLSQKEIEDGFSKLLKYKVVDNYGDNSEYIARENAKNEFINYIKQQQNKRKVVLILPPYHPKLYEEMKKKLPYIIEIEKDITKIANENKIQIIGSYNPGTVNCGLDDFYDGMHPKASCMNKIIREIE